MSASANEIMIECLLSHPRCAGWSTEKAAHLRTLVTRLFAAATHADPAAERNRIVFELMQYDAQALDDIRYATQQICDHSGKLLADRALESAVAAVSIADD